MNPDAEAALFPRAIASRPGFSGVVLGSDRCRAFAEAARRLAADRGLDDIRFDTADALVGDVHDANDDHRLPIHDHLNPYAWGDEPWLILMHR